jgi:hypothetical protein
MVATATDNGILQRMLTAFSGDLPPDAARFFLSLSFADSDIQRMQLLSEKANEGELAPQERDELAMYVMIADFLAIMQSSARATMTKQSATA